ncbi:QRFP-like peptide receptor [Anneissia japonica]|uniref:QRFP-like peptide receptor n=1 Tax=Anneissia japonica TaxID=1529436 RepID=UPI001425919C|nr:QRFP-like peptide receptor [Anneissia japonica]XP_033123130.1 QRFP-like peptide receptor [Anneissia japonica]
MEPEPEPDPEAQLTSVNASSFVEPYPEPEFSHSVQSILVVVAVIFMLIGTLGNALVILTLVRMKNRTITEVFLTSLAFADLFVCVVCIPLLIVGITVHSGHTGFSYIVEQQVFYSSSVASILNLTAVAVDRHDVIINPMNRRITTTRCKYVLVAVWGISLSAAIIIYFIPAQYECILLAVFLFLPLYIMIHCYVKVLKKAKAASEKLTQNKKGDAAQKGGSVDKTVRMVVIIVVMFCVSWIPSLITRTLKYTIHMEEMHLSILEITSCLVAYGGSAINFLVYAFMSRRFKYALMQMLGVKTYCNKVMPSTKSAATNF